MSTGTNTAPASKFEFTLEEQWAIHQAFLDYVEVAMRDDTDLPKPTVEIVILEKLEDGNFSFTAFELERLRYECDHHAESEYTPEIDREPARTVVEKIDRQSGDSGC
ncbi:hypothetical protein C499_06820 [Halogeometricum borinquense DSM 11551]|uniref:Uncharacterized protein n=1 Tax=Halogeometricum borinquense (strain ATCC 700274 / DSM 11551 / JCM 10706 / KCTC 4070 / PR3) TaxID=469382 RepID=E4NUV7_HALBP|nr:hypothetical protein [Halogeometricum borinquense]ADQ68946.1 hypothetical protein Hbor_34240 [Halogeometricum borinquense DSM 11551]ELY28924.1 hypothetical protein C499_06820 [Halogeometricum borinquense DSM 11551]